FGRKVTDRDVLSASTRRHARPTGRGSITGQQAVLGSDRWQQRESREAAMAMWQPDPSFYPSPRQAAKATPEKLAYVAAFDPARKDGDAIATVDVDPASPTYSQIVSTLSVPNAGDEFHHFGWNACSSCLCPNAPHPHMERRYLVVPGLRSSRIYILDT